MRGETSKIGRLFVNGKDLMWLKRLEIEVINRKRHPILHLETLSPRRRGSP